ncbi:uncharacterized protein LOC104892161 [Beta vulgaris subsp. vulgaris]|uniref:uncharacterized protein LOC104892161 n=1 Tax=Beta vulgaris subsp. vulgaris TaxID=3555 RepID=UPI0020366CDE|nr:uncharacterized protein LOC104892161 [Beta vulgaris subsp. vulgaris]
MGTAQFSKRFILFVNLLLLLLFVHSSDVDFEEKGGLKLNSPLIANNNDTKDSDEQKGGIRFGTDSVEVTQVKKEEKFETSNEVIQKDIDRSNISESLQSKEGHDQKIHDDSKNMELKYKDDESGNLGGLGEGFGSKSEPKKDGNEESNGSLIGMEKDKFRDDECDPSRMCVDQKKNFTACLRVPGNDSPDLSLLIRNKGSEPVNVTITAPEFVQLEEAKVQLLPKEDKKVKVTVAYEGLDSLILLTTEDSRCTLDFKELIPRDSIIETHYSFTLRYISNLTRTHCIIFLTLCVFFIFVSAWMCSGLCKKFYQGNMYQTIDMELPISQVSKIGPELNDGWDDSWDDHWDDEEAPKSPALPATPNLSSRGLASRRLNKEGWKD